SLVSSIRLRPPRYALFPDTTLFRSMLAAVARRLPADAAFSGLTAAWLHGLDMAPCDPIEVTIPEPIGSNRRAGASVRRAALCLGEVVVRRGMPTTSALRTVVDLGGRVPL